MYKLFIDDIRDPYILYKEDDWVIAKTYDEAINIILENGAPLEISFDNDLGNNSGGDGYDILKWIIYETNYVIPCIRIHSDNIVASEQIYGLATNWHKHLKLNNSKIIKKSNIQILNERNKK